MQFEKVQNSLRLRTFGKVGRNLFSVHRPVFTKANHEQVPVGPVECFTRHRDQIARRIIRHFKRMFFASFEVIGWIQLYCPGELFRRHWILVRERVALRN